MWSLWCEDTRIEIATIWTNCYGWWRCQLWRGQINWFLALTKATSSFTNFQWNVPVKTAGPSWTTYYFQTKLIRLRHLCSKTLPCVRTVSDIRLTSGLNIAKSVQSKTYVLDRGALLYRVRWLAGKTPKEVTVQYHSYVRSKYGVCSIVLDGYATGHTMKDHDHKWRASAVLKSAK